MGEKGNSVKLENWLCNVASKAKTCITLKLFNAIINI